MSEFIVAKKEGSVGHLTLNRPKALNAITHEMILALSAQLHAWRIDADVKLVLIDSVVSPRAFCAGGDIRFLWESGRQGGDAARQFFADEYRLNAAIASFPKPYIALLDGLTMGGGIGITVHGSHRIVTENSVLSMPESMIGLFPDVGSSFFLNKSPGEIGMYLGLTGGRMNAADAITARVATHFVPHARIEELRTRILAGEAPDDVLASLCANPGPSSLAEYHAAIDRAFGEDSVEAIFAALEDEGDWGRETLAVLKQGSPFSLKLIFAELRAGRGQSLQDCLKMEFRLASRTVGLPEFLEGVRALIIDKDRAPRWNPSRLEDVSISSITPLFAPLKNFELSIPELTIPIAST